MHRVLLSRVKFLASSRECQIRQSPGRDSRAVMTPFMQDTNYVPRNFADLGTLSVKAAACQPFKDLAFTKLFYRPTPGRRQAL